MKKNYFSTFFAALMLLVAMPATAQVSSIADLYGKYKFTATIEPTKDGQEYTDLWKSECEVVIAREEGYDVVKGLLGSPKSQLITNIDDEKFWVNNPNPTESGLWNNQIGVTDLTLENLQMYTMEYYYNSTTKEITIPEFSICQFTFPEGVMTAKELAKVTNVKLTPISEDNDKEEAYDWAGTYTVKANDVQVYKQDYNFPSEFEVEIVYNKDWSMYLITKILGMDVEALNWGGILLTPSEENPNMAEIEVGAKLLTIVPNESYLYLMDMQASKQWNIQITRKEDGTFDMENFTITDENQCVAYYTGVTAVKKSATDGIENTVVENNTVEGIFDLLGRKLDAITVPGLYIVNGKKVIVK